MGKRKDENGSYWVNMRAYEKGLLEWALEACADSPTRAAEMLGINASYLYERCKITNVERPAKPPRPEKEVADATSAGARLKLVPELVEDEVTEDEEIAEEVDDDSSGDTDSIAAEDLADTKDLVTTEDEEAAEEDEDDDEEEEEVPDDECYCGAKLVTEDERERWIECTTCHTNRLTNAAGAVPAVMLDDDDDEEEAG